ncbi:MAG: DUF4339 domain-containing protein [Anaerorhabdus sp.]
MDKVWYVKSPKRKGGPFTEEELIKLISAEIIDKEYEIWAEGMEQWISLEDSVYCFYMPEKEMLNEYGN